MDRLMRIERLRAAYREIGYRQQDLGEPLDKHLVNHLSSIKMTLAEIIDELETPTYREDVDNWTSTVSETDVPMLATLPIQRRVVSRKKKDPRIAARNKRIIQWRNRGWSLLRLAKKFELSEPMISRVIKQAVKP